MVHVDPISVSSGPEKRTRGEHWANATPSSFQNPWESFRDVSRMAILGFLREFNKKSAEDDARDMPRSAQIVPTTTPTYGTPQEKDKMKATWMGHASYLVEMPPDPAAASASAGTKEGAGVGGSKGDSNGRGVTILFDPAYSRKCSPTQWFGSIRYQPAPPLAEIPEVDIICISHNHYDHQDTNTLTELYKRFASRPPVICVGLNGGASLPGVIPKAKVIEMDWWESREVTVLGKGKVLVTCTPAQHMSARGLFDKATALWASWAVKAIPSDASRPAHNLWFGGDTGYRHTLSEEHDAKADTHLPYCPAFKQIGERLGPFSLGLIPIGAYAPRHFLSGVHASPIDAVRIFQDVKAKTAIGIHWGTWHMAYEPVDEPPKLLKDAREALGVTEQQFGVCKVGETRSYDP